MEPGRFIDILISFSRTMYLDYLRMQDLQKTHPMLSALNMILQTVLNTNKASIYFISSLLSLLHCIYLDLDNVGFYIHKHRTKCKNSVNTTKCRCAEE